MTKSFRRDYLMMGVAFTLGMTVANEASAQGTGGLQAVGVQTYGTGADSFSTIFERITTSVEGLPGFLSMAAYFMGIVFAIAGILKIKDHVENPTQTELKAGAIRLFVGGALFALPFVMSVMTNTIGDQSQDITVGNLKKGSFSLAQ